MDFGKILYGKRIDIKCYKEESKKVNTLGPAGLGLSSFRPGSVSSTAAKYSSVASYMDELLVNHSVNALESESSIYVEFTVNGENFAAACDGDTIDWEKESPKGESYMFGLMPLFIYGLKKSVMNDYVTKEQKKEFQTAFLNCCNAYAANSSVGKADLLLLCDSFYYSYIKDKNIASNDYSVDRNTFEIGYSTGSFSEMELLNKVYNKPSFSIETKRRRRNTRAETTKVVNTYEECMEGNFRIPYAWNEKQSVFIPSLSTLSTYVPDKTFFSVLSKISNRMNRILTRMDAGKIGVEAIANDYINLTIAGKPGTGKTVTAYALGAATGMPTYTVALSKNSEEDTFEGVTKVVDGKLSFISTDFLEAFTNGGIIILEEVNLADPAVVMGAIGQAIEFPFVLKKNGYETVRRHPLCIIVSTMNIGTYGSKGVNQAFSSRFKQSYILDDPTRGQFIKILGINGYEKRKCEYVYDAYNKIVNYLKTPQINAEDICLNLSIRGCLGALQNMDDGDDPKTALENSLIGKIYEVDPEIASDVKKNVISSLPNL